MTKPKSLSNFKLYCLKNGVAKHNSFYYEFSCIKNNKKYELIELENGSSYVEVFSGEYHNVLEKHISCFKALKELN